MRELISCPRSGHKSSKRVIALVFCAVASILALVLATLIVIRPDGNVDALKLLASVIGALILGAGGTQATTGFGSKNTGRQEYAEPTTYTDR